MHYKKTQISGSNGFDALRRQLGGHAAWHEPSIARHSGVMFEQLEQLSGSRLAQFSRGIGATFGTTPWKSRQQQEAGDVVGLLLDSLKQEWMRGVESYVKQMLKSELSGVGPAMSSSGRNSSGQMMADFASLLTKSIGRNL